MTMDDNSAVAALLMGGGGAGGVFLGGVECFWIRQGSHTELPATLRSPTVPVLLYVGIVRVHFAYLNLQILKNTKRYTVFPRGYRRKKYAYLPRGLGTKSVPLEAWEPIMCT